MSVDVASSNGAVQTLSLEHQTTDKGLSIWKTETPVNVPDESGLYYRFHIEDEHYNDHDFLDLVWRRPLNNTFFNFIEGRIEKKAHKVGPIADVYQDSACLTPTSRSTSKSIRILC